MNIKEGDYEKVKDCAVEFLTRKGFHVKPKTLLGWCMAHTYLPSEEISYHFFTMMEKGLLSMDASFKIGLNS